MHWCPNCGKPCFCDGDDTDYGEIVPDGCNHFCDDRDEFDDDEEEEGEE
jgi:hypothetical protein